MRVLVTVPVLAAVLTCAAVAHGSPIPQSREFEPFIGEPATPHPLTAPDPPRHPFMAPNGRSNLHNDAYQTDVYEGYGPLGRGGLTQTSALYTSDCASITFDSKGRIVTVCVGIAQVTLRMLDPKTLETLASYALPGRNPLGGNPFTNFSGGGYFYLDDKDRAVLTTAEKHLLTISETDGPGFKVDRDIDLNGAIPESDQVISSLPDWTGRIWVASKGGLVLTVDKDTGAIRSYDTKEGNGNSFAVDRDGSVSIVTNTALYRFEAGPDGTPKVVWREQYDNDGTQKSGQTQPGSGSTPTLIGDRYVAITDNADPLNVVVYQRGRTFTGSSRVTCKIPIFKKGRSSDDQSLIATPDLIVAANNHGYDSPASVELGQTTTPGLEGIRLRPDGSCEKQWHSDEIGPTVVAKLSLAGGIVYTYTKPARSDGGDPWYLTALDARTGRTLFKALAGEGLGYNNNYAPITLAADGAAYVGVLGGVVKLQDNEPLPPLPGAPKPVKKRVKLTMSCLHGRPRATVTGANIRDVLVRVAGVKGVRRDTRRGFALNLQGRPRARVSVTVRFNDDRAARTLHGRIPRCRQP